VLTTSTAAGDPVTFDAANVDPATVEFAGALAEQWSYDDKDGDGELDLVLHFEAQQLQLTSDSTEGTLTGQTFRGTAFIGSDAVRVLESKD